MPIEFTPSQMRNLVVDALKAHNTNLGQQAEELFNKGFDEAIAENIIQDENEIIQISESSWQLREIDVPKIQRSIPAHAIAESFIDETGRQCLIYPDNPNPHAVIQYEYNGSLNSLIYLGHEVGHALADILTREAGYDPKEWPSENAEIQAYYIQNILYDYLEKNYPELKEAVHEHKHEITKEIGSLKTNFQLNANDTRPRAIDFTIAKNLFDIASSNPHSKDMILETIIGTHGSKNLDEILKIAQTKSVEPNHQFQL